MVIRKISNYINSFVKALCALGLCFMAVILFIQVCLRYIFGGGLPWVEECSRYVTIWIVIMAGSSLIKEDEMLKVDFFDYLWPVKAIRIRNLIYRAILVLVFYILIWQGWLQAWSSVKIRLYSMNISWFWVYLAIPIGGSLMLIQYILFTILEFTENAKQNACIERKEEKK